MSDLPQLRPSDVTTSIPTKFKNRFATITMAFTNLEVTTQRLIWAVLDIPPPIGKLITARLDARPKFELAKALMERKLPLLSADAPPKNFWKLAEYVTEDRNTIVHSTWFKNKTKDEVIGFSLRTGLRGKVDPDKYVGGQRFNAERLDNTIQTIKRLDLTLRQLLEIIVASQKKPPRKQNPAKRTRRASFKRKTQ